MFIVSSLTLSLGIRRSCLLPATYHDRTLFPGQDYNNARVLDFQVQYTRHRNSMGGTDS
jgi:hypothetical protein